MTTTTSTQLYWAEDGSVCCLDHAPYPGSDTWVWDHWQAMTDDDRVALALEMGRPVGCECCSSIARRRAEARP